MDDDTADRVLFGSVPPDLFRVFAGRARFVLAELLAQLAQDPFGQPGEIVTRKRALDAVAGFIERAGRVAARAALDEEADPAEAELPTHVGAYNRLLRTGWLVEYRDRYRRVVDFDPSARLLLHTLLDIRDGRVRSYGGAVLNVLTLLRSVAADPTGNALNVREAAMAARGFMNHLRTVAGTMRRVEGLIMAQPTASALVRAFVSDFIEAEVVQDYRNLHSRESPYRFRHLILELADTLVEDEAVLAQVADGWTRGGIGGSRVRQGGAPSSLRDAVIADLRDTARVFAAIDDHVHDIEATTFRIERRTTNVIRFSDRMATIGTDRLQRAIEALARSPLGPGDAVEVPAPLRLESLPLAPAHLFVPARPRREPAERVVEVRPPDPALLRYLDAVNRFELRTSITPDRLRDYVGRALRGREEARPGDFPLATVDDFLLFERLHHVGLPPLDREFEFRETGGPVATPWIERPGFVVRRRTREDADGRAA
ncbi:MAG: hypothetical protein INR65_05620 [Gluconacetobacter diazotrophicus]|nr:hypothetical protein [Gluconacetobacter diazotrophicus]